MQGNTIQARYLRGNGLILSYGTAGQSYYLYNGHGDVVQLANNSGAITWKYDYNAFGNEREIAGQDAALDNNPFRYSGEYFDKETGKIYLRARYYAPGTGRFLTEDPIRDGLNWYAYAANNPIRFFDPSGLIITGWDRAHLTFYELALLAIYTDTWMVDPEAHNKAEAIRNQYRTAAEYGTGDGNTGIFNMPYHSEHYSGDSELTIIYYESELPQMNEEGQLTTIFTTPESAQAAKLADELAMGIAGGGIAVRGTKVISTGANAVKKYVTNLNLKSLSDNFLKNRGIDPHDFEYDILKQTNVKDQTIAHYNIRRDINTNELYLVPNNTNLPSIKTERILE